MLPPPQKKKEKKEGKNTWFYPDSICGVHLNSRIFSSVCWTVARTRFRLVIRVIFRWRSIFPVCPHFIDPHSPEKPDSASCECFCLSCMTKIYCTVPCKDERELRPPLWHNEALNVIYNSAFSAASLEIIKTKWTRICDRFNLESRSSNEHPFQIQLITGRHRQCGINSCRLFADSEFPSFWRTRYRLFYLNL